MLDLPFKRIGIIGTGLLGTSMGLAIAQTFPHVSLGLYDRQSDHQEIAEMRIFGAIKGTHLSRLLQVVDMVIVAVPPAHMEKVFHAINDYGRPNLLVTDVCSVKEEVMVKGQAMLRRDIRLVGGHPMAGGECGGPINAHSKLFHGATWFLCKGQEAREEDLVSIGRLVSALGAFPVEVDPVDHDRMAARISHVPHVQAAVIATCIRKGDLPFVGNGYRDTTRIAAGDPKLWTSILSGNQQHVLDELTKYSDNLRAFIGLLANKDSQGIEQFLVQAQGKVQRGGNT